MLIIAGLGNPGQKYENNRHNIGFMAVDAIARAHGFSVWTNKFSAQVAEGRLGTQKVLLVKPQTFMNLSGQSVGEAARFYKVEPEQVTVFHDELDLAPGRVRIKTGGGHGGHNGLKSVDAHLGREYRRVRLGIGHPGDKARVNPHVLGDFAKADQAWLEPLLDAIARAAPDLTTGDSSKFMNRITLAMADQLGEDAKPAAKAAPKAQRHVRQARKPTGSTPPATGPMAEMLRKLLGKN